MTETATPTDQQGFIQAIIANPGDDQLRHIYADWLEERADPQGEFIRVQYQLASGKALNHISLSQKARDELKAREQQLLKEHRNEWLSLPSGFPQEVANMIEFRRGFPEHGTVATVAHAKALLKEVPTITSLQLTGIHTGERIGIHTGEEIEQLAASPYLFRLTTLDLQCNHIGDTGIRSLAASPHVSHLTNLSLGSNDITDAGADALATSPNLSRLASLNLENNRISDTGIRALLASPHLLNLVALDLRYTDVTYGGVRALADAGMYRSEKEGVWTRLSKVKRLAECTSQVQVPRR